MVEPVEAKRSRTQTILLGVIAACLIILVVVFVVLPIVEETNRQNLVDVFNEVSSQLPSR